MLNIFDQKIVHEKINDDVTVKNGGYLILHGQIAKNLYVETGGKAVIHGMIVENLHISTGAHAVIHGMVCKNLINEGNFSAPGMICGSISNLVSE